MENLYLFGGHFEWLKNPVAALPNTILLHFFGILQNVVMNTTTEN
jgi:hypothetical protein